jgi:hypothetical protein
MVMETAIVETETVMVITTETVTAMETATDIKTSAVTKNRFTN